MAYFSQLAIVAKQLEEVFDELSNRKVSLNEVFSLIEIFILLNKLSDEERNYIIDYLKRKYY